MTKRFGHTYWGDRWLTSLKALDNKNRLHRGKNPAKKGSVTHFSRKGGNIFAKVRSTGKQPHQQLIKIPGFSSQEKSLITSTIRNSPFLLSQVLYHELPSHLEEELKKTDICLFPRGWNELQVNCSCSDWTVPCQHISAVLYAITGEIDNNPFFIFQLRGLDIQSHLKKQGFEGGKKKSIFFSIDSILTEGDNKTVKENTKTEETKVIKTVTEREKQSPFTCSPDFSTIQKLTDSLLHLLQPCPLFYDKGDFKKLYARALELSAVYGAKLFETTGSSKKKSEMEQKQEKEYPADWQLDSIKTIYIKEDFCSCFFLDTGEYTLDDNFLTFFDHFFRGKSKNDLLNRSEELHFLYLVYSFSLVLLKQGAFIPQLMELEKDRYKIRWLPAVQNNPVEEIYKGLLDCMPAKMICFISDNKQNFPGAPQQLLSLISLFLGSGIKAACYDGLQDFDRIYHLFFGNGIFSTAYGEEEKNIPHTIHLWLSRFYFIHQETAVIVKIDHRANSKTGNGSAEESGYFLEIMIKINDNEETSYLSLPELFKRDELKELRQTVLRDMELITEYIPQLKKLYESKGKETITFSSADFEDFFYNILPVLKLLGIQLLIPKQLYKVVNPALTVHLVPKKTAASQVSYLTLDSMISFEWKVALGSTILAPGDFKKMVEGAAGIIYLQDQFVFINPAQIDTILKKCAEKEKISEKELFQAAIDESFEDSKVSISNEARSLIKNYRQLPQTAPPALLRATLRDYQLTGFRWLYKNIKSRTGSLLADDMGLGKTIQICALLAKLKEEHSFLREKCLIVVPTSLLTNWQEELSRFTPLLDVLVYHGQGRKLELTGTDIIITTYGIIRSEEELFCSIKWELLILDEAQNIKNAYSSQAKSIKKLESIHKIALSGTPVENRLSEYWSIFDFVQKGFLGSLEVFTKEFAVPIEKYRNSKTLTHFKNITSPFILRRLKSDAAILNDLPDKLEFDEYCNLTGEQSALYQSIVNKTMQTIENSTGIEREGLILKMMTGLKQVCNHPGHYTKARRINPAGSGKTLLLLDLLQKIFSNQEKVLIFTQFSRMGELLQDVFRKNYNLETPFLHGGITRKMRDSMVKQFQQDKNTPAFLLSLMAGGTGLNLTSASFVIHFDLWWNPAVESQATDRAYRIGQKKNVMVYRFITKGTFEEKINAILQQKKELAELTVSSGSSWLGELSDFELGQIVKLD